MAVDSEAGQDPASQKLEDNNGLMAINLSNLEAETRCPVCLGVIKNARLVSGCMHRFCAECIEKWLRVCRENNCPQCRMPMQSRRDCKKDGKYDRLLRLLYDDIEKYETEMLDADDAILEQAMQTGAALKRARDNQKAARKPRVDLPQSVGQQRLQGMEYKGPYRSIPVGAYQWTTPSSYLKTELTEGAADRATASEAADAIDGKSDSAGTQAARSTGQDQQGTSQTALGRQTQTQSAAQRALSLHQTTSGQFCTIKAEPSSHAVSDNSRGQSQTAPGPGQTASRPTKFPLGSPARIVPLSSVQPLGPSQNAPPQSVLAPRAITVPHAFPLGSTTGIVGRSWPGQPTYGQPVGSNGKPVSAGSGLNETRGTKRAGGAESKSRKRQKHGDREKSADGEGGRQSTGPIAAFLRPLPPAQPESEAKDMAASLAATAAALAQQQEHAVHAMVQVHVTPESARNGQATVPTLQKSYLSCPADMQIEQLQKVVAQDLQEAGHTQVDGLDMTNASGPAGRQTSLLQQNATLGELAGRQQGLHQYLELQFRSKHSG